MLDFKPSVIFLITDRCNLRCPFCFVDDMRAKREASPETFKSVIRKYRPLLLQITGGEPTVHKSFEKLLKWALARVPVVTVSTNGAGGYDRYRWLEKLWKKPHIGFSLDAPDERHDAIRGRKGLFDDILSAATGLKKSRVPVAFAATITGPGDFAALPEGNLGMARGLISLAKRLRIPINLQPYHLTAPETRAELGRILLAERAPFVINSRPYREMLLDGVDRACAYNKLNISIDAAGEPLPTAPGDCYFSPDCKRCYYSCVWEPTFLASDRVADVAGSFVRQFVKMNL